MTYRSKAAVATVVLTCLVGGPELAAAEQATPQPTASTSPGASPSATAEATGNPDTADTPSPETSGTADPTTTPTPSPTPTPTPTPTLTPTPTPTPTTTPSPTAPGNQAPHARRDEVRVRAGSSVTVHVLANDADDGLGRAPARAPRLKVISATTQRRGRLTHDARTLSYRPTRGMHGRVVLRYEVSDGELRSTGEVVVRVARAAPRRKVTLHLPRDMVAQRRYRISGRVRPIDPRAEQVRIRRLNHHGKWVHYRTVRVRRDGTFSTTYKPVRNRWTSFRAVADWPNGRHKRADPVRRWVSARLDVKVSGPLRPRDVPYSWRSGCPVPPGQLREVRMNRFDYRHTIRRGSVIVHEAHVDEVVRAMRGAFRKRFPIRRMTPTDFFYRDGRRTPEQSDVAAMRAGNTSAFNCRHVTGNPYRISQHSYGNAIDINTIRNPYVTGSRVYPSWARKFLDRSHYRKGMIMPRGVIAKRMRTAGWLWGARWSHPDYQHFSSNGG